MVKKPQSISIEESIWNDLAIPAEKQGLSKNQLVQKLVEHYVKTGRMGEQDTPTALSIDSLIKAENLERLKLKNQEHREVQSIKKRKLEATTKIIEYHAEHLDVIGATPSRAAKTAMEHHVNQTQPYDENAIYCPDCKWHSNSRDSISYQIDRITDHVRYHHKRNFTEDEAKIISELLI